MTRSPLLIVMCAGYFLVLLDVTIVNVALPAIGDGLAAGPAGLQWVVDGYAIAIAGLLLAGGTIGDVHGHRRVMLAGLGVFGAASLACGLAPSVGWLVAARFAQGAGAALLLPGTLAIITEAYPEPGARARAIGVWAGVGSAALPLGPLLGGLLVDTLGWRSVFVVNVPVVLVAAVMTVRLAPRGERMAGRVDWTGALVATALLTTVTVAVIAGLPWLTVPAVVLLGVFVAVERAATEPMLPLDVFRGRTFGVANGVAGVMNLCTLGLLFLVTQYLQTVRHEPALAAGLALLPLFLPLTLLAPYAGRAVARFGARPPMIAGLVLAAAGFAVLTGLVPESPYWTLLLALLLWGIGLAALTPAVVAAAVGAADGRPGLASGVNNTARQAGGAVGIAVFGAVAGSASNARTFLSGLHMSGVAAALLFLVAGLSTVLMRSN